MMSKILKTYLVSVLLILFVTPGISQYSGVKVAGMSGDSVNCGVYLSTYREFLRINLYQYAREPWLKAFDDCPGSSEKMYVDGVNIYQEFIETTPDGPIREGLIDTLMLIYDRRMEYFGDEGNVLGRKGKDLLKYRSADIEQVQKAYEMLSNSIEIQKDKSQESVMLVFISAGTVLNNNQKIDDQQVIKDYLAVIGILDQLEKRSSRWERTREKINEILLREDILSCDALNRYYEPQFEQNKSNSAFLETMIKLYSVSGCNRSDIYAAASENLYRIEPGSESAHNLAILFITRSDNEKAAAYLKEAVRGENVETETRAQWYYELGVVSLANKDYCEAIEYARESINLKSDLGVAYMLLGDAFIASRDNLGDDFQQRTAYWAASEKYSKAASLDPSLAEEASQKLNECAGQYPTKEDVFFHDIKEGEPYLVRGCINENTLVRSRQ